MAAWFLCVELGATATTPETKTLIYEMKPEDLYSAFHSEPKSQLWSLGLLSH